jgi:outer membrane biosynthesis protein TonB
MRIAVDEVIERRRQSEPGMRRSVSMSLAIHAGAVLILLAVPEAWRSREPVKPVLMTINFGGTIGEKTGGMVAAGARTVEEVAPPPKRSVPTPLAPPPKAKNPIAVPAKPAAKPTPTPAATAAKSTPAAKKPPVTGAQVTKGTAVAETGSKVQSTGLASGGGQGGNPSVITDVEFCCPTWIDELQRRILVEWIRHQKQPVVGSVTVVFEVSRDGSFTAPVVEEGKSSPDVLLKLASLSAFRGLKLPRLPAEYKEDKLKVHLTFPYVR